jgi:type II secretory pathway pseudopilin PulG
MRNKGFTQLGSRKTNLSKGFTLVEIIVSTGIFMTVLTVSVSALIVLNNASRQARAVRTTMDNANQAVEAVTRVVRMGFQFDVQPTCATLRATSTDQTNSMAISMGAASSYTISGGGGCIGFYAPDKTGTGVARYTFRYNAASSSMERSFDRGATWQRMTAPEVKVTRLAFYGNGTARNGDQPFISIVMQGTIATFKGQQLPFNIQASADPRTPNSDLIYKNSP